MQARILIVDDEIIVAESMRLMLQESGYIVTGIAVSEAEALVLIAGDAPDLVFMDINLGLDQEGIRCF